LALLRAVLLLHELFLRFLRLVLQSEVVGLLLQLSSLPLCCLVKQNQLLIVFLAQLQLLLFHLLVYSQDVFLLFLLGAGI
jgi:hypothetical protein